ncbi:MAG TPA: EamA family transporter [Candidatus Polarisedimenticolia bacterium]|nr:EamA family transporter [Candidatus Polarisedimenticolia bacterium]
MTAADPATRRHRLLVTLNFAAVYLLWGSTYLAIRYGLMTLPPALMAGTRFFTAGAILLAFLLWRRVPLPPRAMLGPIALIGMLMLFGGNLLVTVAELTVSSGMAAVIVANLPFFMVAIESMYGDGERLSLMGGVGLLVGFTGMLILTWPKLVAVGFRNPWEMRGEMALLGANLCWAIGSIYSKHKVRDTAPLMSVALQMLFAGTALLLFGFLLGEAPRYHMDRGSALAVAWLVVAGSLFGYSAYIWLLSHVPAVKVSTYAYVNPVIALLLGWLLLDEPLDARVGFGTLVILAGVAIVNIARVRKRVAA